MNKRKVSLDQLRTMVQARRTKGSAFSLDHRAYDALQAKVKAELTVMSYYEILEAYPEYTYDIKL